MLAWLDSRPGGEGGPRDWWDVCRFCRFVVRVQARKGILIGGCFCAKHLVIMGMMNAFDEFYCTFCYRLISNRQDFVIVYGAHYRSKPV